MRRLSIFMVVAAAAVLVPTWAWAGNQEVAEQIAASLRESGQLQGYKVGVKFQDGTAWLKGQVSSAEQMNTALTLAAQTPGVGRVVNNLTVDAQTPVGESPAEQVAADPAAGRGSNPLTHVLKRFPAASSARTVPQSGQTVVPEPPRQGSARAQRLPTTFAQGSALPAAAMAVPGAVLVATTDQRMPMPMAYAQPPVPEGTEAGAVPQPIPPGTPQPIPPGAPQPLPAPIPQYAGPVPTGAMPAARYDQPHLPNYAWPGYAAYPNYAGVTYPRQYSPMAWPYIGPFYPYPQAPLGWRKVTLEWHDGWWFLDFDDCSAHGWFSGLFRHHD